MGARGAGPGGSHLPGWWPCPDHHPEDGSLTSSQGGPAWDLQWAEVGELGVGRRDGA